MLNLIEKKMYFFTAHATCSMTFPEREIQN